MRPIELMRHAACAAMLALAACSAFAQSSLGVVRWPGSDLYIEANSSSRSLGNVPRGEKVEYLARDGLWRKVRWQGKEGWMNRVFIDWQADEPATAPVAQSVASPSPSMAVAPSPVPAPAVTPAAVPAPAVVAAVPAAAPQQRPASPAASASPRGRAVVFGISNYRPDLGIASLDGVASDMQSASAMAQLMGISADRITTYRNGDVTTAGMAAILTQLAKEITEGEPVLLYYSGHGGRMTDPTQPGRCIEGLTMYDGQLMTNTAMAELLHPLARITDQLFVFFDSCHSGGLSVTRATGEQTFKPKFAARGDVSNCSEVVNMLQTPPPGTRATGNKYVYAAAARANEVSLDTAVGGLATTNFLSCMTRGSGTAQTVEALRACAQMGINQALSGNSSFKPHNMTITGDLSVVPVRADLSPERRQQIVAQARSAASLGNSKAARVSAELAGKGWAPVFNPQQAFAGVASRSDAALQLTVDTPRTLKIDTESLRISVRAPADGYLYIFQATSDGKNAVMLFPNLLDRDNRARAGQSLELPRPSWPLVAGGPEGESQLLVVFSRAERDISQLSGQEAGPFLDLAVSPAGMQALALAVSRSAWADDADCKAQAARPAQCDAAYAAALKVIREVR